MNEAEKFISQKQLFQLGALPTETPHAKTRELSHLAQHDLSQALQVMRQIDLEAVRKILADFSDYKGLFTAVAQTLDQGQRIYLVGCGATGRLSMSLEYLWRRKHPGSDQVRSLMAGGDVALVHSLEGFEDFPEFGARHLKQLGFTSRDLLIGTTEGGETPYVIGAVELAAVESETQPHFLYCNSRQILLEKVERSRRVLQNPKIHSLSLETGPMALTGSTRMQASTVLMLVVGLALDFSHDWAGARLELERWLAQLEQSAVEPLAAFTQLEAETYRDGGFTCYEAEDLAITVFTDTTERAPTFNLAPFDNPKHPAQKHSLTYISIPSAATALEAWQKLLAREPRPLEWPEVHGKTSADYLLSFDFGRAAIGFREKLVQGYPQYSFQVHNRGPELTFKFRGLEAKFALPNRPLLDHLSAKMLLNMHSTLVMGRLGRFEGNLMTWVYPSNGKLVDRAARYTQILLQERGLIFDYDSIIRAQFAAKARLSPKESIVHKTIEILENKT